MRVGSFINHCDRPNVHLLPNRDGYRNLAFVANRDIEQGEEVTITYVDPDIEEEERRRLLATQYFIYDS